MKTTALYLLALTSALLAGYAQAKMTAVSEMDLSRLKVETYAGDAVATLTAGTPYIKFRDRDSESTHQITHLRREKDDGAIVEAWADESRLKTSVTDGVEYDEVIAGQRFDVHVTGSGTIHFRLPVSFSYQRDTPSRFPPDGEDFMSYFALVMNDGGIFDPGSLAWWVGTSDSTSGQFANDDLVFFLNIPDSGLNQSSFTLRFENYLLAYAPTIPEPETYVMLVAGLGLTGLVARRKSAFAVNR